LGEGEAFKFRCLGNQAISLTRSTPPYRPLLSGI
jgi:hypothetical protein